MRSSISNNILSPPDRSFDPLLLKMYKIATVCVEELEARLDDEEEENFDHVSSVDQLGLEYVSRRFSIRFRLRGFGWIHCVAPLRTTRSISNILRLLTRWGKRNLGRMLSNILFMIPQPIYLHIPESVLRLRPSWAIEVLLRRRVSSSVGVCHGRDSNWDEQTRCDGPGPARHPWE